MKVKKKKKSRLAVVFLCVAAVFALLWGGAELLRHLTHYGETQRSARRSSPDSRTSRPRIHKLRKTA